MVNYQYLGLIEYARALIVQQDLWERRVSQFIEDTVLFCEHPLTYTIGSGGNADNLLMEPDEFRKLGAKLYRVKRGGDITCHSPGQLVAYPIIRYRDYFRDAHWYLRGLEDVIIGCLKGWGIEGERIRGLTGVWVKGRKIASIGVRISKGVTTQGLALNINNDLRYFDHIIPCGLPLPITSVSEILGRSVSVDDVQAAMIEAFNCILGIKENVQGKMSRTYLINSSNKGIIA